MHSSPHRSFVEISSAGTWALEGHAATGDARRTAAAHGLDLSDHRARQLTPELVAAADVVIGMEHEHADEARRLGARRAITLEQQIRDPYGLSLEVYGNTWALLATLVPAALADLD